MSSEVSFASDSMAFRFRGRSFVHGVRRSAPAQPRPRITMARISDSAPSRSRLDVTIGNAVVVGVEPEPVGRDRGVEADDDRGRRGQEAGEQADAHHVERARAGLVQRRGRRSIDDDPEEHEHRDRVHVDEHARRRSRPATAPGPRRACRGAAWSRSAPRGSRPASRSPRGTRGTSTSSAGNVRNDSKRFSIVMPASMSTMPASARIGSDSSTMRRRIGSPATRDADDGRADRERRRTAIAIDRRDEVEAEQVGREEQARERRPCRPPR